MWRCSQAVQTTAQRWLRRNTSTSQFARTHQQHYSARLYSPSAFSITRAFGQSSLFNRPSILSGSGSHPSLVGYGDVKTNNLLNQSNPLLISCHAFSTRGGKRPRGPDFRGLQSVDEIIVVAYEHRDVMSRRDVSAFWTCISKLMTKRQPKQRSKSSNNNNNIGEISFEDMEYMLYTIFDDTANRIKHFNARELTETTLGMAKIIKILRQQGKRRGEDSSRVILRRLLLSKDLNPNRELFKFFARASIDMLDRFDARYLSNLAYAYALIDCVPEFDDGSDLFDHIAMNAVDVKAELNAQEISNMTWAYATVNKSHAVLFEAIGDEVVAYQYLEEFDPQALSNIVWAYATAGVPHPSLFEKVANYIVESKSLDRFIPQALSNTIWAYTTANVRHPRLFEKVANHIVESDNLNRFDPQALSNIVWAYATAQVSHPKIFRKVAKAAIQRKTEFNSQDVANLLWAYSAMGITDKQLFSSFVPKAAKLIDSYTNQGLANIAWAYAVADVDDPTLFNAHFNKKCVEKKDGFETEALCQLYQWHLWQTKEKSNPGPSIELQDKCYDIFISKEPTVSKLQDDVVAQLSSIGLEPKEEVLMGSGYRIDAIVEVNGKTIGIEVDGPSHFIGRSKPTGSTILKRRQVPSIDGIELVAVPHWEWNKLLGKDEVKRQDYLRKLLGLKSDNN